MNGKAVVRLKGGDPFVFGRGGEEILALKKHNIPYDIVPGITSAIAVPELAGIPVTHRKMSRGFHVITGHTAEDLIPENIKKYASTDETLVILMGLNNLSKITETLILNGKDKNTPAAVISHGASAKQKTIRSDLKNIADEVKKHKIKTPAVIIIGETAAFDFSTNINRLLTGVSVSVTGTEKLVDKLSEQLYALGADINKLDYLQICEYGNNKIFYDSLLNIQKYSMIVLTSMNGAEIFLKHFKKLKIDIRKLGNVKFAVIGNGTGEILEKAGIYPDIIPEIYTAKELGKRIAETVSETDKLLILRAEKGSSVLTDVLDKSGIIYDDIKTFLERNKPRKNHIIWIVFISGFFILFFIGFAMGKLWSDSLSFSQFGIQILKCVVFSILGCALIIPVHEFIHWIAYKKEGANDVRFGAIWKSFVFYAAAHNFAADYKTFRRIALAPFYILSVLLVLLFLFPVPLWGKISIAAILLFHIVSCSGDLSMLSYMKRYKRRNVITVDDIDNRFTYFMEK